MQTSNETAQLEEDLHKIISHIHSLSSENEDTQSFNTSSRRESFNFNAYYGVLSNLLALFQPLLREGFIDDLPITLVCLLSGRQDCGLEAELTKVVFLELGKPLLGFVSSQRSQACPSLNSNADSNSFFNYYLRMGQSTVTTLHSFQQTFLNILSNIPLSGNLMSAVSSLVDAAVRYATTFMAMLLQLPMDYIKIALQFGIRIPSLDGKETCEQGKQLFFFIIE